jgi:quercetin dioxygenase-like cupin family protein
MPCELPGHRCTAVHFAAGAHTRPHVHPHGQQIVVVDGVGVIGDDEGVRIIRPGDVSTVAPGRWHWHGAVRSSPMTHVTVQPPGIEMDIPQRDWDAYPDELAP